MVVNRNSEPRVTTIEGRRVLVVQRRPPLPANLQSLLSAMSGLSLRQLRIFGTRSACEREDDHRLTPFATGRYRAMDGVTRDLRLSMCVDCEAVQVRDVTNETIVDDSLPRIRKLVARGRKDSILGWYSGARRNGRVYMAPMTR